MASLKCDDLLHDLIVGQIPEGLKRLLVLGPKMQHMARRQRIRTSSGTQKVHIVFALSQPCSGQQTQVSFNDICWPNPGRGRLPWGSGRKDVEFNNVSASVVSSTRNLYPNAYFETLSRKKSKHARASNGGSNKTTWLNDRNRPETSAQSGRQHQPINLHGARGGPWTPSGRSRQPTGRQRARSMRRRAAGGGQRTGGSSGRFLNSIWPPPQS